MYREEKRKAVHCCYAFQRGQIKRACNVEIDLESPGLESILQRIYFCSRKIIQCKLGATVYIIDR